MSVAVPGVCCLWSQYRYVNVLLSQARYLAMENCLLIVVRFQVAVRRGVWRGRTVCRLLSDFGWLSGAVSGERELSADCCPISGGCQARCLARENCLLVVVRFQVAVRRGVWRGRTVCWLLSDFRWLSGAVSGEGELSELRSRPDRGNLYSVQRTGQRRIPERSADLVP